MGEEVWADCRGIRSDQIPAKQFFGLAVVLDVSAEAAKDADYQMPVSRVEEWEKKYGRIVEGSDLIRFRPNNFLVWPSFWMSARKRRRMLTIRCQFRASKNGRRSMGGL